LEATTDHWDFWPGSLMQVGGWKAQQFSASLGASECVFDYGEWMDKKAMSLGVQANFESVPRSFSIRFGFTSPTNGDPFRLLIVNENNPPLPLRLAKAFVQTDRQGLSASLEAPMRDCLLTNFALLGGWQWQLQPFIKPKARPAQYLYKDWPAEDIPAFGNELEFARIGHRLREQGQNLKKRLEVLSQALGRPLGTFLGMTNEHLKSFLAFSPGHLTPGRFLAYLSELKKSAPDKSWIKQWQDRPDSDQPDEVAGNLQLLYELWSQKESQDQPLLTVTNKSGTTNYFFASWRQLAENLKEREQMRDQLDNARERLEELDQVAYIGLMMVDPKQPGTALEMIRFEGP